MFCLCTHSSLSEEFQEHAVGKSLVIHSKFKNDPSTPFRSFAFPQCFTYSSLGDRKLRRGNSNPPSPITTFQFRSLRPTSRDLPDHKSVYCQFPKAKPWLEFIRITSRQRTTQWAVLVQVNIWCLLGLWGLTVWLEFSTFWTKFLSSRSSSDWLWFPCLRERTCHYSVRLLWKNKRIKLGKWTFISGTDKDFGKARDGGVDAHGGGVALSSSSISAIFLFCVFVTCCCLVAVVVHESTGMICTAPLEQD